MSATNINFNRVDALPTWTADLEGEIFFVKDDGIYIATSADFEPYALKGSEPIIITFPSTSLATADTQKGQQGEITYMPDVISGDDFYTTISAETTDTKETYLAKLKKSLVLLDGNVPNYIPVSYIEDTETNKLTLTWHTHFWQERDDEKMANYIADCICIIDFEDHEVGFAMTQYTEDEAHMATPYEIVIDVNATKNDSNETITTISLKDANNESITCPDIIGWLRKGYRVIFGALNSDGDFVASDQDYDIWFFNDNQIALRYPNIERKSINGSYYYTNSYSIVVFDEDGTCQSNDTTKTFVKGYSYNWRPIQDVEGDSYITASIDHADDDYANVLTINATTHDIDTASSTSNGLATALDVKTYVESKLTSTDTYQLVLNDDGSLQCIKNSTDEGFVLNDDGSLELA